MALDRGLLSGETYFTERDRGLQAAADFLVRRSEEDVRAGRSYIEWALPRLSGLNALRREIVLHLLAWWPEGKTVLEDWLEDALEIAGVDPVQHLLELTFVERLQGEAGFGLRADQVEMPLAVRWARRVGLEQFIAAVLETLGERRREVYLEQWRSASGPARVALARALRWLTLDGPPLGEPLLDRAIEASHPSTGTERVLELIGSAQVRRAWLEILPIDPGRAQIEALGTLLVRDGGPRAERTAILSTERLSEHPDLVLVWTVLGPRRRRWLERVEPRSLHSLSLLLVELQKRKLGTEEAADLKLLQARLDGGRPQRQPVAGRGNG